MFSPNPSGLPLRPLPALIFASRWLQLPLYLGLIAAQAVYVFHFWVELVHLLEAAFGSQTALQAHGLSMADVVKCTVMLADMSEWGAFNDVYKTYFSGNFPARSAFGSNGLAFNARVEVECIAAWRK